MTNKLLLATVTSLLEVEEVISTPIIEANTTNNRKKVMIIPVMVAKTYLKNAFMKF